MKNGIPLERWQPVLWNLSFQLNSMHFMQFIATISGPQKYTTIVVLQRILWGIHKKTWWVPFSTEININSLNSKLTITKGHNVFIWVLVQMLFDTSDYRYHQLKLILWLQAVSYCMRRCKKSNQKKTGFKTF